MNRKDYKYLLMTIFWLGMLFVSFNLGKMSVQPQLDGLTNQLDRTQYQLKKVSEESADKTARIAELTGNGG
ncbi:hypothetical protein [Streptococcus parauberis]|uniref:hypothetical protein n=1 Tax=Streptococcus parauberis TaxID=1348 RepID=UPI0002FB9F7A|nr:hypothetical protein [Streptococcus parauberis]QBX17932.1 hypothetical protein Javan385_0029 [Streptococcus phage Javan385]UWM92154.1 hypothetical protein N2A94_04370 [Streptococcus parauberis]